MFLQITEYFRKWSLSHVRLTSWRRGRYVRALEDEVARLRAENHALINSILGVAGIPPARFAGAAAKAIAARADDAAMAASPGGSFACGRADQMNENVAVSTDVPLRSVRRRSWQQIGRALEIEDARAAQRERESNSDTFPAPRNIVPRP